MQTEARRQWKLNEALSLALLSPMASLYAPVAPPSGPQSLPHLAWRPDRSFHTSALCASALDSITLPYRLHRPAPTSPLGCPTGTHTSSLPPLCLLPTALHGCFPLEVVGCHAVHAAPAGATCTRHPATLLTASKAKHATTGLSKQHLAELISNIRFTFAVNTATLLQGTRLTLKLSGCSQAGNLQNFHGLSELLCCRTFALRPPRTMQ